MSKATANASWQPRAEPELVPYQPLRELGIGALMVLAPHPDDEVFGCGGLLALAVAQGVRVQVVVVSDGAAGGDAPQREQECRAAAREIGYLTHADALQFWRLPDRGVVPDDALVQRMIQAITHGRADWVLSPSPFEIHPDHRAVCLAAISACQVAGARLAFYEVGQALMPNCLVDISAVLPIKQRAMHCFTSQLAVQDYGEHVTALNRYRSYTLGVGVTHAEALCFVDASCLAAGIDGVMAAVQRRLVDPQPSAMDTQQLAQRALELQRRLESTERDYAALERGYLQVTRSLSWRITSPLRWMRGVFDRQGIRRPLLGAAWWAARRLDPRTRQRLKAGLAARAWGAPVLRWLTSAAITPQPAAGAAGTSPPQEVVLDKEAIRAEAEATLTDFLAQGRRIAFAPHVSQAKVSVVVVLYNQAGLSLLCLQALAAITQPAFELIIVDNASSDRMPELLARIDGATVLRQQENLGFVRAVNLAAGLAQGEYLLLLNNDALVFPDTLARAADRLDREPDAGAVGGAILWWDGRLQEAGSVIWQDGSCAGYGRGDSPDAGPYRFVRDVDYCSGALLMLRRALFEAMGGFDERFAPAYYEESDFCVRLWQAGHRVVYDPAVRVKHFEFASDVGSGQAMVLQARHRALFEAKHPGFLGHQQPPSGSAMLRGRMRLPPGTPRVLVVDDRVPLPSLGRGYPRAAGLVQALVRAGAFVTHYPLLFPHEDWADVYAVLPERVEVMQGHGMAGLAQFLRDRAGCYDLVLVSRPHNMEVLQAIRKQDATVLGQARLVYDAEALFSLRDIARAAILSGPLPADEQRRMVAAEMALAQGADTIITVSDVEARHYRDAGFRRVHVLGHALLPRPTRAGFDERAGFLFVGALEADNSPNTDSVLWFVREVWPLVCAAMGGHARLDVVGPCESASVLALSGGTVKVWGRVGALEPFYERARVFIAPTRFSAGIPHKAHEAAANGLPIVASTLIADQLGWHDPAFLHAADARAFADACIALHSDKALWHASRQFALNAVERDCAPQAFDGTVRHLLQEQPVMAAADVATAAP